MVLKAKRKNVKPAAPVKPKRELSESEALSSSVPKAPSSDNKVVPAFIEKKWLSKVLPTLYHCFFASKDSFGAFAKGSDKLLDNVKGILELVFPNHTYEVRHSSKVVQNVSLILHSYRHPLLTPWQVYDRITEKRSQFGRNALTVVDAFFQDSKYHGKPEKIQRYAQWALQPNGPALFLKPTPIENNAEQGEVGYIVRIQAFRLSACH